ncbi:hypothetical protein [Streptomyces sp. DH12]|uniref:hypothetical protein n=1 Tax=Streptomyces sp. DH12 TaxID=2857010 RepID=UPI001E5C3B24|nr:hypothetical protein [Streptomyces sp. DH12]
MRGTPMRRSPDGPLPGVLRDLKRQSSKAAAARRVPGPPGPEGPPGPPGPTPAAGIVTTGADGRAEWRFPSDGGAPVIAATPVQPSGLDAPVYVLLETVKPGVVTVRAWEDRPGATPGARAARPVPGVTVHLTAIPASPVP